MKRIIFILLVLGMHSITFAGNNNYGDIYQAEFVRNYDGDTITVNIDSVHPLLGDTISVRINGIDTPEIRGKCLKEKELAYRAKELVYNLAHGKRVDLKNIGRGKYFRILADVEVDGVSIAEELVANELAVPYEGGTKKSWCK